MRNLALSAASTWYLGVAAILILSLFVAVTVSMSTLQGQWEVDEVVVNDCKI